MKNTTKRNLEHLSKINRNPKVNPLDIEWHITGDDLAAMLECAKAALSDADMFDDEAERFGISDSEMKTIQEKLNDDPATLHLVRCVESHDNLVSELRKQSERLKYFLKEADELSDQDKEILTDMRNSICETIRESGESVPYSITNF